MDTTLWKPVNVWTWTAAALLVVLPAITVAIVDAGTADVANEAISVLIIMMVLNLGLALAPLVADRYWLLRLPIVLLMLPVLGVLTLGMPVGLGMVAGSTESGSPVWAVVPALLVFSVYLSTGLRLLVVGTPVTRLILPTPRGHEPAEGDSDVPAATWR